jgi:hypothetical protein
LVPFSKPLCANSRGPFDPFDELRAQDEGLLPAIDGNVYVIERTRLLPGQAPEQVGKEKIFTGGKRDWGFRT